MSDQKIVGWEPFNEEAEIKKFAKFFAETYPIHDKEQDSEKWARKEIGRQCWLAAKRQAEYENRSPVTIEKIGTGHYYAVDSFGDAVSYAIEPALTRSDLVTFVESLGYRVLNKEEDE
jgi:hypothetical protein